MQQVFPKVVFDRLSLSRNLKEVSITGTIHFALSTTHAKCNEIDYDGRARDYGAL